VVAVVVVPMAVMAMVTVVVVMMAVMTVMAVVVMAMVTVMTVVMAAAAVHHMPAAATTVAAAVTAATMTASISGGGGESRHADSNRCGKGEDCNALKHVSGSFGSSAEDHPRVRTSYVAQDAAGGCVGHHTNGECDVAGRAEAGAMGRCNRRLMG
jgi:hypothetical protein